MIVWQFTDRRGGDPALLYAPRFYMQRNLRYGYDKRRAVVAVRQMIRERR